MTNIKLAGLRFFRYKILHFCDLIFEEFFHLKINNYILNKLSEIF